MILKRTILRIARGTRANLNRAMVAGRGDG
jgi:hypothetical protein